MLKYYIDEDGELKSSQNSDLVVQTSKGVDTIVVELPYEDTLASSTASITIRNPKGVESYEYLMTYTPSTTTSPQKLSFLLNDAWFSSVKGNYEFTVRIYGTSNYNITDNGSLELVVSESENVSVLVFTKGYYKVLEAVNVGATPTPPTPSVYDELIAAIGLKANTTYVNEKDGELRDDIDTLDGRVLDIENNYVNATRVQQIYDSNTKVKDVLASTSPMKVQVKTGGSSTATKEIAINLNDTVVSVEEEQNGTIPNIEIANANSSNISKKVQDSYTTNTGIIERVNVSHSSLDLTETEELENGEKTIKGLAYTTNFIAFNKSKILPSLSTIYNTTITKDGINYVDEEETFTITWKQLKQLIDELL